MRWALLIATVLAGCAYQSASSTETTRREPAAAVRTEVGCLDIGVARRADRATTAVVHYTFANTCAQPATVDLGWASVIGRTAEGAELALVPSLRAESLVQIAPHASAETSLAYPATTSIGQLCVDVASLAQTTPARWRCFGNVAAVAVR